MSHGQFWWISYILDVAYKGVNFRALHSNTSRENMDILQWPPSSFTPSTDRYSGIFIYIDPCLSIFSCRVPWISGIGPLYSSGGTEGPPGIMGVAFVRGSSRGSGVYPLHREGF